MNLFRESVEAILPQVITWRRHLHQHPEPSYEEFQTTEYLIEQIKKLPDVTYERLSATGVVAKFSCARPGPVIALRGDIDALRMNEESGESFSSQNEGIMHACGHDSHAAMLLGALYVLYEHRQELEGGFVFIFQAAEELFPGGAKELVEKGALNGVSAVLGQHAGPWYPTGHIGTCQGYITANSDTFEIIVNGRGGHASAPQNCLDPIPAAAQIVTAVQNIVSRHIPANEQAVVSITTIHSGSANNVIPDTVVMTGTTRTYTQENRDYIEGAIRRITAHIAEAFEMTAEVNYKRGYGCMYNTPEYTQALMELADELYGPGTAITAEPGMGGEDFGCYLEKVPGCFYYYGSGNADKGSDKPTHNSQFRIDEDSFPVALSIMVNGAIRFQELAKQK
jgi:amidohydrolase